ncbi:MAG: hypothetical protein AAF409_16075 [Pseudomonadota bacterium]
MATINGNGQDNVLLGTIGDDLIRGRGGNDEISGGDGDDRLKGGAGNDIIEDGAGSDRLWGGSGSDTFKLVAGDGERERIQDWEDGLDTLDLSDWGVTQLSDLSFTNLSNGQVRITFGAEEVQLKGKGGVTLTDQDFDPSDFIFAAPAPVQQVVGFESLSIADPQFGAPIAFVDPGHEGFTWSQSFYFVEQDDLAALGRTAGSDNRTSGGNVFATNGFGDDVDFSAADNFDFESFVAGAVYNDGMTLRVVGMDDGQFVGDQTFTLNTRGETQIALDDQIFDSVDQVVFQTYGGTLNPTYGINAPDTTHAYFDDFVLLV